MSDLLYSTRLRWSDSRRKGAVKHHGKRVELDAPPVLEGFPFIAEIDYVPEVHACRIRHLGEGWRDMEHIEIMAADNYIRKLIP